MTTAKKSRAPKSPVPRSAKAAGLHIAVVGAGMAGVVCARTLVQAGHRVTLFEKSRGLGGRMSTRRTEFGGFDHGAQYFTVRDARFETALRSNATSGNLQYKNGPVWVGAAFDRLDSSTHLALVAGGYDFGVVHTKASYSRAKGGVNGDATAYSVSAMVPLSFGRTYLMVGLLKPATQLDSQMIGAGLQYDLSKRTLLYTNLGTAKRDGLTRTTAIDFGVKHTF